MIRRRALLATAAAVAARPGWAQPAAPTGLEFVQPRPAHPAMGFRTVLGVLRPVGGVGPYRFALANNLGGKYGVEAATGLVASVWTPLGTTEDRLDVSVTDGLGRTARQSVPVRKTAETPYLFLGIPPTVDDNVLRPAAELAFAAAVFGGAHSAKTDRFELTDPSGQWGFSWLAIRPARDAIPPLGSYPVRLTATATDGHVLTADGTIVLVAARPIRDVALVLEPFSAATPPGTTIGRLVATTPSNARTMALEDDAGGRYRLDGSTGAFSVAAPLQPGTDRVAVKVTDKLAVHAETIALTVRPGRVLPPGNMTMAVSKTLINAGRDQPVGQPAVAGLAGGVTWSMVQTSAKPSIESGAYVLPRRYAIDPASGRVTAPGLLSQQTDQLTITASNGTDTCTRSFDAVVNAAPPGPVFHVGRGQAALHGALGFEHIRDVMPKFLAERPEKDWPTVRLYADADPDYYADDCRDPTNNYRLRGGWHGPVTITGVPRAGVRPRTGGRIGSARGGYDANQKAFWLFNNGDAVLEEVDVSDVHGGGDGKDWPRAAKSGVRKDSHSYGNLTLRRCRITACDQGVQTGESTGSVFIEACEIGGAGTSLSGTGETHNVYLGDGWRAEVRDSIFFGATSGHNFKSRMEFGLFEGNRFYDMERGSSSCLLEMPDGGEYVVRRNRFHKGTMANNGAAVQFCAEMATDHAVNTLLLEDNEFFITTPTGNRFTAGSRGSPGACAIRHWRRPNRRGEFPATTTRRDRFWLPPGGSMTQDVVTEIRSGRWFTYMHTETDPAPIPQVAIEAPGLLTEPPALDLSRPGRPGMVQRLGDYIFLVDKTGNYRNWSYMQIDPGIDDIRVPASAAVGTVVARCRATGCDYFTLSAEQPNPRTEPFGPGTAWSLPMDPTAYRTVPWAPAGRYAIDPATGVVTVGAALQRGVDLIQVRAAAPGGAVCDNRFYISVV